MALTDASQQALIKASYKDTFYVNILRTRLADLCQQIFGDQYWIKWKQEVGVLADVLYFVLTTIRGSQTLGEEYVCAIQVDTTKKKIPSTLRRTMQVMLQCTSPYVIDKLIKHSEAKVSRMYGLSDTQKRNLIQLLKFMGKLSPVAYQLHTLLFYLQGIYMSISKRIAGVKHILIRPYDKTESDAHTFKWLAVLLSVQVLSKVYELVTEFKKDLNNVKKVERKISIDRATVSKSEIKCILCLDNVREMSTTACGHVFCWECIVDWCRVKSECPTCREKCSPSRVVRLHHYEMSSSLQ